jgi:hypothetical protein
VSVATAFANLVKVTTATTGTGTMTLGSAVTGFRGTSALTDQATYAYTIIQTSGYEDGHGVYTASGTTLTRVVDDSSNSGSAITLAGGEQVIVGHLLAGDLVPTFVPITATGTGSSQNITLPAALGVADVWVMFNGLVQDPSSYSISSTTLTVTAPNGASILVRRAGTGIIGATPRTGSVTVTIGATHGAWAQESSFSVPGVTTTSIIICSVSGAVPSLQPDELELDPCWAFGRCATNGTLLVRLVSTGRIRGSRVVNYSLY